VPQVNSLPPTPDAHVVGTGAALKASIAERVCLLVCPLRHAVPCYAMLSPQGALLHLRDCACDAGDHDAVAGEHTPSVHTLCSHLCSRALHTRWTPLWTPLRSHLSQAVALSYYGNTFAAAGLGGSVYLNELLLGVVPFPARTRTPRAKAGKGTATATRHPGPSSRAGALPVQLPMRALHGPPEAGAAAGVEHSTASHIGPFWCYASTPLHAMR
jgi:hypothetical protein